ncbi:non-ribosomal peptide synthetase, partial [Paracoccus onubensis]
PLADILPLSPLQQGFLFHASYDDEADDAYIVQMVFALDGPLDTGRLHRAMRAMLARHPNLAARFEMAGARMVQLIPRQPDLPWLLHSPDGTPAERQAERDAILHADRHARFNLGNEPPIRATLIREHKNKHCCAITTHHIAIDGWSLPVFLDELFALYDAPDTELPHATPYAEYIRWTVSRTNTDSTGFWRDQLEGLEEPTLISPDSAGQSAGKILSRRLDRNATARLDSRARDLGITLNALIQSAWALYLSRRTGQHDVVFGTTVSGRPADLPGVERMVGLFINTLPLRLRPDPALSASEFMRQTHDSLSAILEHQHVPLSTLQRVGGHDRLFDTLTVFENYPSGPADGDAGNAALIVERHSQHGGDATHYPMGLAAVPGESLKLTLSYRGDLFGIEEARRVLDNVEAILAALADHADRKLGRIGLLDAGATAEMLEILRGGDHPRENQSLPGLVCDAARRMPHATALICGETRLDYAGLERDSAALARQLIRAGVRRGQIVAMLLPRGIPAITALLAIMRAGAVYLPLDPGYPQNRIAAVLADAAPTLIVTDRLNAALVPHHPHLLTDEEPSISFAANEPLIQPQASDPAYVIYTSGSTGRPKGVLLSHASAVNAILSRAERYPLPDVSLLLPSLAFDASLAVIFGALANASTLVLPEPGAEKQPAELARLIERHKIREWISGPGLWRAVLEEGAADLTSLRTVVLGGEAIPVSLVAAHRQAVTAELWNEYGPTEAAIWCASALVTKGGTRQNLIGRPISNMQFHILDASLQAVPVGVVGELYISGAGLAQGYLNRPDLTAERFLANPFSPGQRMYRSGDLARWREDGQVEFIGRADQQIKIRGFRIEPGEIEAAIAREGYPQAAVIAREDRPGQKQLAAYVVAPELELDCDALRRALAAALPDYMVPAAILRLDELPLTPNGKLDRRALPAPVIAAGPRRAPRNETEAKLAALFAEVLGIDSPGIDDSFFALGGDSISSIQLVARARKAGITVTARDVVQKQTVAALAPLIQPASDIRARPAVPASGELPMTPIMLDMVAQGGDWSRFQQTVLLDIPPADPDALAAALNDLLGCHPILNARLAGKDRLHVPSDPPCADILTVIDSDFLAGSQWEIGLKAAALDAAARLDPQQGRLMQAVLFRSGDITRLLLTIHHLAIDGVSWRILLPDLAEALAARHDGRAPDLQAAATPFREWALAMPEAAQARLEQLPFWQSIASRPQSQLAARSLDPAKDHFGAQSLLHVALDAATTRTLMTHATRRIGGGMNEVLLTALALAVAHWHGHAGLTLNVEGHGREDIMPGADLSRSLGWFTSLFPLHLDVGRPGDPSQLSALAIETALKSVKEALAAIPENGIGYGLLRHMTTEGATLAGHPAPEIGFNFLGRFDTGGNLAGWRIAPEGLALSGGAPEQPLAHALELNALINGETPRLQADWTWAGDLFGSHDIAELAELWLTALRRIAETCAASDGRLLTPSDLPGCALDQPRIDAIEASHAPVAEILPLSPLQQGFLFHSLYDRDAEDIYLSQITFTLKGALDPDRLHRAALALLARHPAQTASFLHEGLDHPVQVIPALPELAWRNVELEGPADTALSALQDKDIAQPMPLHDGPLLRFTLARETAQRHHLVLTNHHIIMDGWSTPLFLRDLLALYHADGDDPALPEIPAWRDYLDWLATRDEQAAMQAWHDAFDGLEQPALLAGGVVAKAPARLHVDHLSGELSHMLQALSRRLGVTLNTLVQTAWALVLRTELGQDDLVLGSTTSGRSADLPGIEHMAGLFINTIPLRFTLRPAETLADILLRIQHEHALLLDHDHLGLARIQKAVGQGSLFDTLVVFENYPMGEEPQGGLEARFRDNRGGDTSHYPVSIGITPGARFEVKFSTRPDVIDTARAERLRRRLTAALELLARHSDQRLARLSLLEEGEASLLSGPRDDRPANSLIEAFRIQAATTPDQIALVCRDEHLDWTTLSAKVNRLAHHLAMQGAAPGQAVAIALPRGAESVIAMLAVAHSGAAWVTLDMDQPDERLRDMARRADCALVIATAGTAARLSEPGMTAVLLDDKATLSQIAVLPDDPAGLPHAAEDDLAYIIFTSGSTGQPKGVRIAHGNIANLLAQHRGAFYDPMRVAKGRRLRMAVSAPFSFDTALAGLLWMVSGHELHVLSDDDRRDGFRMVSYCRDRQIDAIDVGPTHFEQLREIGLLEGDQKYPSIIAFGGEAVSPAQWRAVQVPGVTAFNAYGPTEGTIDSTFGEVTGDDVVIGRPLRNGQIAILDASLQAVPVGVVGELYISGAGLAQGYLNRPDLTAERFLANPFSPG